MLKRAKQMATSEPHNKANVLFDRPDGVRSGAINLFSAFAESDIEISIVAPDQDPPIYCSTCSLDFVDSAEFAHHNFEMHGQNRIPCPICNTHFRRQDHMKRHLHTVHSLEKSTACPVCSKECKRQDLLKRHMKNCHPPDSQYQCKECEFVTDSLQQLELHGACHIVPERHVCGECQASFKRRDHLNRHYKSRHTNAYIECTVCRQLFKRRDHMLRHIREKHQMAYSDCLKQTTSTN